MAMYEANQAVNWPTPANGHAVRQTQISAECAELGEKTELLLKQLADLEEQLNIVLRPADVETQMKVNDAKQPAPLAPHASFLRERNHLLYMANEQLKSILNRIEL